jgi:2-polyprenyl-3-methyl-5-hydroxy-6-metoxy-1,4-benzoquinol methylase
LNGGPAKKHSGRLTMPPFNPQNLLRAICLAERLLIKNYFRSYLTTKFRYGKRMLGHRLRGQPRVCPYCGPGSPISRLQRKKLIVDILQCDSCRLIFRWPTDTLEELDQHYDSQYAQEAPQVRLPEPRELPALFDADFAPLFGDLRYKIGVLRAVKPSGRVLDYGCSWGYATSLLRKTGYDAIGFEISKPRAAYAREHLGVPVVDSLAELESLPGGSFDVIYSNHVLEHVPAIGKTLALFARLLRGDGVAFHILPNFTGKAARAGLWLAWIGEDHPIAPTVEFFERTLPAVGLGRFRFASSPFDTNSVAAIQGKAAKLSQLDGDELLILAQKADRST